MNPYITEITPITVAGTITQIPLSNVNCHADIPAFFFSDIYKETEAKETNTHNLKLHFKKSNVIKHCEILLCYDTDPHKNEFSYFFGRAIVHQDDIQNIPSDLKVVVLNGLYAIFTSQLVPARKDDQYEIAIKSLWHDIMNKWLPNSEFEYDNTRKDFEYYDVKDHGQFFNGNKQMDIYIPIKQKKEAYDDAEKKGFVFVEDYE